MSRTRKVDLNFLHHRYLILDEIDKNKPLNALRTRQGLGMNNCSFYKAYKHLHEKGFIIKKPLVGTRVLIKLSKKGYEFLDAWKCFVEKIEELENG